MKKRPPHRSKRKPPPNGNMERSISNDGVRKPPPNGSMERPMSNDGVRKPPANGSMERPMSNDGVRKPPANGSMESPMSNDGVRKPPPNGSMKRPIPNGGVKPPTLSNILNSESIDYLKLQAWLYLQYRILDRADILLTFLEKQCPELRDVRRMRALLLLEQHRYAESATIFHELLTSSVSTSERAALYLCYSKSLAKTGRLPEARDARRSYLSCRKQMTAESEL